ncbi:MAG: hypothetical protein V4724_39540 [Pseudomonadota bacterium]
MVSRQKQPTKEQIRQYLNERKAERTPPPALEEIRKRLGWTGRRQLLFPPTETGIDDPDSATGAVQLNCASLR